MNLYVRYHISMGYTPPGLSSPPKKSKISGKQKRLSTNWGDWWSRQYYSHFSGFFCFFFIFYFFSSYTIKQFETHRQFILIFLQKNLKVAVENGFCVIDVNAQEKGCFVLLTSSSLPSFAYSIFLDT